LAKIEHGERGYEWGDAGVALLDDGEWGLVVLVTVGARGVEIEPVGLVLVPEVDAGGEERTVEELVLLEAMDGLDIGLPGMGLGRDVAVLAAEEADRGWHAAFLGVLLELGTVVGLPGDGTQIDAAPSQVGADQFGHERRVGLADFVGVAGEGQTADDLAHRVLEAGQPQAAHLGPVGRDIGQILGVVAQLAEQGPKAFDRRELLLGLVLAFPRLDEVMLAQNAFDGAFAARDVPLVPQAGGPGARLPPQRHDRAFLVGWNLVRTAMRSPGTTVQAGRTLVAGAADPFANRVARTSIETRRGPHTVLPSVAHDVLPLEVAVAVHPIDRPIRKSHSRELTPSGPIRGHLRRWPLIAFLASGDTTPTRAIPRT
jgi:hypothetical protein